MADSIPLSTFPAPLAHLLLYGGDGLPAAWGPVTAIARGVWDPLAGVVREPTGRREYDPLAPQHYVPRLPLDAASPWPARMAVVAAHLLGGEEIRGASVYWSDAVLLTLAWLIDGDRESVCFNAETGEEVYFGHWNLPTLPAHLSAHSPEVALLLALYAVPAIKARVEALQ